MNPDELPPSPMEHSNIISKFFFCWMTDLLLLGSKKDLELSDLYRLAPGNKSENLGNALSEAWREQVTQAEEWNAKNSDSPRVPSLYKAIKKVYFWQVTVLGLIVFINECILKIAQPVCLGYLIRYFGDAVGEKFGDTEGYLFGLGLFVSTAMFALNFHPFYFVTLALGMRLRVACSSLIYRKCLKLSQASIGKTNVGQMVNLIANDVNRFDISVCYLHYVWVGPIQLAIATYILWGYYDWSCLVGLTVLVLFAPIQSLMGKLLGILRLKVAERTDQRVRVMSEFVNAVRIIKMYAWEFPFAKIISAARADEISYIRKTAFLRAVNVSCYYISAKGALFLTLLAYALAGNPLTAEKVFVTLLMLQNIRLCMTYYFANAISQVSEAFASIKRLDEFLLMEERHVPPRPMEKGYRIRRVCDGEAIVTNMSARWSGTASADVNTLEDISLRVHAGQLLAVVGSVGSGKTSLLQVLLHELPAISGVVHVKGKIAYANQEPWIFSGTVRENILFGKEYEYDRYHRVIQACALTKDMILLPYKDQTIVGDKGISLSGGQKARINLARAVYSDSDVYLLDDPLSAVDAEVAKHIFENCIMGILKEKAKVLVTHQLQFLMPADEIILLDRGKIEARGSYKDLLKTRKDFAHALNPEENAPLRRENSLGERPQHSFKLKGMGHADRTGSIKIRRRSSISFPEMGALGCAVMTNEIEWDDGPMRGRVGGSVRRHGSSRRRAKPFFASLRKPKESTDAISIEPSPEHGEDTPLAPPQAPEETILSGEIPCSLYWEYISAGAMWLVLLFLLTFVILAQLLFSGSDLWLQHWTKEEMKPGPHDEDDKRERIYVYCAFIGSLFIVCLIKNFVFLNICVNASAALHRRLFEGVMRAPMRFFELNAAGRVMSRFAKDIGIIDETLPLNIFETVEIGMQLIGAATVVSINIPYLAIPFFILTIVFYFIRKFYLKTSNSLRRLEGLARSPVFNHLSTSISGLTTIRAMRVEAQFEKQFDAHQDLHSAAWYLFLAAPRWLGIVVDLWCVLYMGVVLVVFFIEKESQPISAIGLSIASGMTLITLFQFVIRRSTEADNDMVSVERVQEYAEIEPEASLESTPGNKPQSNWPERGEIVFNNLVMKYGEDAPVLKNIDCVFKSQEKVGIVGRTGAGKSSLITALFRLTEPFEGNIEIDGINVLKIGLHDLRKKISIIPQDPLLFNATIRKNLDPFGEYQDEVLWNALEDAYLATTIKEYPSGLDTEIADDGSNFSVGQRQLLCLARAILRRCTMLVLDEATAAVDHVTDALIQRTIREKFATCTLLTIAHRLHTVMDSDRILVLDAGRVKEFDEPYSLLCNESSALFQLVETTGKATAATLLKIAKTTHDNRRLANMDRILEINE